MLIHGNVPGSYVFNRYRRCRWTIDSQHLFQTQSNLSSEDRFSSLAASLRTVWAARYGSEEERVAADKPMMLNRSWDESPDSSIELLGGMDDEEPRKKTGAGLGNTELYGFPGMVFEVTKGDMVSCLTLYRC